MSAPWIVNLVPAPESSQVKLLKPIRLSIRDSDTHIDPTSIRAVAGYARVCSNASQFFDKQLPATKRFHLYNESGSEPVLSLTDDGVYVEQISLLEERTLYATSIDGGPGYKSVMLTAILKPGQDNAEPGSGGNGPLGPSVFPGGLFPLPFSSGSGGAGGEGSGAVLAIENGPRNKVVYLWFQNSGTRILRLTSYLTGTEDPPTINLQTNFDWSDFHRYTILWNEVEGYVEVYADSATGDSQVFRVAIADIPEMPSDYYVKVGGAGSLTALYGLVANAPEDNVTISNVAFTSDVGFPVLGTIRPGDFVTSIHSTELVKTTGAVDPREAVVSAWMDTPESLIAARDSAGATAATAGIFTMVKPTVAKTFSIYREEPALLASDTDGFMVQARLHVSPTATDGAATGMGFTIFDGQSVFQVQLFKDPTFNTIGILRKGGSNQDITEHFLPDTNIDWSAGHLFRIVVDPRRSLILFYDGDDLNTPVGEVPFDRANLPSSADFGWTGETPFIALGHTMPTTTSGTFSLYEFSFCHLYQAWDTSDANVPTAADPVFTKDTAGAPTDGLTSDGDFQIVATTGDLVQFHRDVEFGAHRGGIIEFRAKIESWRPLTRTGVYVFLDDGLHVYALTFVETSVGKFVALSQRSSLGSFQEVVGRDGNAAKISFLLDWTEYHTYRIERRPFDGVKVYVDDETDPRIAFPESKLGELPDEQFGGTPKLAFGQFTDEGATSRWSFVRGLFSRGYDISFKKNKPDAVLRTELYKTQALIIAHAQDEDA